MNKKIQESWKPQIVCLVVFGSLVTLFSGRVSGEESRRLPVAEYRDRMAAGWIGQVVGVGWGAPTEFRFKGEIDMGLLYGERRMEDTIVVSMRCGQDSDCNPSNAAGVLATTMGKSRLMPRFVSQLNPEGVFTKDEREKIKITRSTEK